MHIQLIFIILLSSQFYCYRIDFEKGAEISYLSRNYFSYWNVKIIEELELRTMGITKIDENTFMNMTELKYLYLSDNNITHLPTYVFSNLTSLKDLNLKFNNLHNLDENLFQNLTELISLNLHNNHINKIDKNLFANLRKLETLNLYNNEIAVFEIGTFDNNIQLQYLDLYNNYITEIKYGIFSNLINLSKLYLSANRIKNIDSNAFPLNSSLTQLILGNNQLEYLNSKIILNLKQLKYLTLYNNPWNCDMKLKNLVEACRNIDLTTHTFYDMPTCAKPTRLANRKWNSLTDADFILNMSITTEPNGSLSVGTNVKLSCRNNLDTATEDKLTTLEWVYQDNTSVVDSLEAANRTFISKYVWDRQGVLWNNLTIHAVQESDARVYKCVLKVDAEVVEKSKMLMVFSVVKPV